MLRFCFKGKKPKEIDKNSWISFTHRQDYWNISCSVEENIGDRLQYIIWEQWVFSKHYFYAWDASPKNYSNDRSCLAAVVVYLLLLLLLLLLTAIIVQAKFCVWVEFCKESWVFVSLKWWKPCQAIDIVILCVFLMKKRDRISSSCEVQWISSVALKLQK